MVEVRYVPATREESWRVALAPGTIVALPPNVSVPTVEAVWRRLGERGIGAVIEALTGAFGTSLAAIPDFLLAIVESDGVRVAVRGPVELVVETPAGAEAVSGAGVATWVERHVPGAVRVSAGLASSADEATALPIVEGIVAVDAMTLTIGSSRPGAVAARPRPVAGQVAPEAAAAPVSPEAPAAPAAPSLPVDPEPRSVDPAPEPVRPAPEPVGPVDPVEAEPVQPVPSQAGDDYAMLWGDTIARPVQAAAKADDETPLLGDAPGPQVGGPADDATIVSSPRPATPSPAPAAGDHDGETIAVADIRGIRRGAGAGTDTASFEATAIVPARQLSRGRIRVSDGQVVELERTVIVGRRPRSPRAAGDTLPTLVAVESPEQDISRNHIEIRSEGEHVLAVDLDTTNGTVLLRGGNDPVRLHPNEPTMVVNGDVLDLGDGITIEFEDLP